MRTRIINEAKRQWVARTYTSETEMERRGLWPTTLTLSEYIEAALWEVGL